MKELRLRFCAVLASATLHACGPRESGAGAMASTEAREATTLAQTSAPLSAFTTATQPARPAALRVIKRTPRVGDHYTVRFSDSEARVRAPENPEDAKLELVQEAELYVTCRAVLNDSCTRTEIAVRGHSFKKSLDASDSRTMRLSDSYTVEGLFAPENMNKRGEKLGYEEERSLLDLANIVARVALQHALPDDVRVGDKLQKVAAAFRIGATDVDATVTAIDGAAGAFSYRVTTSQTDSNEVVSRMSLENTITMTVSSATGLPTAETSRSKFFTSYRQGETQTRIRERRSVLSYDLR